MVFGAPSKRVDDRLGLLGRMRSANLFWRTLIRKCLNVFSTMKIMMMK